MLLWATTSAAQDLPPVSEATDYARLHEGVNPPKLVHSSDPEYTPQAIQAGIKGSVILQAVVDKAGRVAYGSVLSPLPAGLDTRALATARTWQYSPGVMDGETIPVLVTIDVLFRLPYKPPDPVAESRQKAFDGIVDRLSSGQPTPTVDEVKEVSALAAQGFMPAVGLLGQWRVTGTGVGKNVADGMAKVQAAAEHNDAKSLCFAGKAELGGTLVSKNEDHGWRLIQRAAFFGDAEAEALLGDKNEHAANWNEAKRYFRFCAATAHADCEYRLGRLLVQGAGVNPNDFSQGVAWLELSTEHGSKEADVLYGVSRAKLSSLQVDWVAQLKPHLELRHFRISPWSRRD